MVEDFLSALAKNEPVAYGFDEVEQAIIQGAAEQVLVATSNVRECEAILAQAEKIGATVSIISDVHEAGEKLVALGGLAAFLRYQIS